MHWVVSTTSILYKIFFHNSFREESAVFFWCPEVILATACHTWDNISGACDIVSQFLPT